jgi:cytochrome c oxidase cbb3-type subunit 3
MSQQQKHSSTDTQQDKVRPHVYDGIQEYDNRMPNWWLWTFYGAIIFSAIYWFSFYDTKMMKTDEAAIAIEMSKIEEIRLAQIGDINNEALWQMSRNEGFVQAGHELYMDKCVACHGADLRGGIGVDLLDDEWLWGNQPVSMYAVVKDGSPDRMAGMQAWISELGPRGVSQVVAFILSQHDEQAMAEATSVNQPIGL